MSRRRKAGALNGHDPLRVGALDTIFPASALSVGTRLTTIVAMPGELEAEVSVVVRRAVPPAERERLRDDAIEIAVHGPGHLTQCGVNIDARARGWEREKVRRCRNKPHHVLVYRSSGLATFLFVCGTHAEAGHGIHPGYILAFLPIGDAFLAEVERRRAGAAEARR